MSREVALVAADGTVVPLSGPTFKLGINPGLWGPPPVVNRSDETLGLHGAVYRGSRLLPRPIRCPIWVDAADDLELDRSLAQLARWTNALNPVECRLIVTRSDGTAREIGVRYSSGFESLPLRDRSRARALVELVFVANDPLWRAVSETERDILTTVFAGGEPTPFSANIAFSANIPFSGTNAAGLAEFSLNLTSDVEVPVRFEVEGPGTALMVANVGANRHWALETSLVAGDRFVVDSARPRVTLNDQNVMSSLTSNSRLWNLRSGSNLIEMRLREWEPGVSQVRMIWLERFLTC